MKAHRWTDEDLQQVKEKRVREVAVNQRGVPSRVPARAHASPVGSPSPQKLPYKSKLEFAWALRLEVMKREGEIDGWIYEPFTFRLAEGKRYRADFIAWGVNQYDNSDGSKWEIPFLVAYECKGWHKNYRDSMTHLSWAAQKFPFFEWKKVVRNGKTGFEVYDVRV